ncbi:MAG: hypothetical protein KIT69_11250, partial [Propionibacteriaceae bacterium]|nr:hypothetical protein [Propionibacteriaceae bacterium]
MPQTRRPTTSRTAKDAPQPHRSRRAQLHEAKLREAGTRRLRRWLAIVGAGIVVALVGYGLWSAAPTGGDTATTAPDFTLPTTDGGTVTLSALRG